MNTEKKITILFTILSTSLVLFYSTLNWFGWYFLSTKGKNLSSCYLLDIPYTQWTSFAEQTRFIHFALCIIYSIIIGTLYLFGKFSFRRYFYYNINYFLIQVSIIYIIMGIFDPNGVTGGLHYLCAIPYRYYRWGFIVLIGVIGLIINKFKKMQHCGQ